MNKHLSIGTIYPPSLAATAMWAPFRQQMDDLFDHFWDRLDTFPYAPFKSLENTWSKSARDLTAVPVEVNETEDSYNITAELPGVEEKGIEVSVEDGVLAIEGEKHGGKEQKARHRYVSECSYGSFRRTFGLPRGVDENKIEASFHNGVLTVSIPKPPVPPAKKIELKAA